MSQEKKVYLDLVIQDGNTMSLIGAFRRAAKKQGFEKNWIENICKEAISEDYDKVIQTLIEHTTIDNPLKDAATILATENFKKSQNDINKKTGGTYWENRGNFQELQDEYWEKLVPASGKADTHHGELLRMINRFYYDVYNNGLCNDKKEEVKFILNSTEDFAPFINSKQLETITKKLKFYEQYGGDDNDEDDGFFYGDGDFYNDSKPFCYSLSLDLLVDAILLYVDKVERKLKRLSLSPQNGNSLSSK